MRVTHQSLVGKCVRRARRAGVGLACLALVACGARHEASDPAATQPAAERSAALDSATPPDPSAAAAQPAHSRSAGVRVVPGELLVKFKPGIPAAARAETLANASLRVTRVFHSVPGLQLVTATDGRDAAIAAAALEDISDVEYVEPNFIYSAAAIPNDPEFPRQRGLNNTGQFQETPPTIFPDINAPEGWDIATGAADVVVAVVDSGVDYVHEDLAANMYRNERECVPNGVDDDANGYVDDCYGIDTANQDSDPMDDAYHGTHVAGILGAAGNNGVGIAGVAWRVKILPCKFLSVEGSGTTAGAIQCLDYIAALRERGVNIVATNNSWGGGGQSRALDEAIARQRELGILFVAAAGNEGLDTDVLPYYPCAYDRANVICVGSAYDQLVRYSNHGIATVHLGAPGDSVLSTVPGNRYEMSDGTSMATPHVTGAIVLLTAQDPGRDWRALKNLVLAGTQPASFGIRVTVTNGRLDVLRALTCSNASVLARLRPTLLDDIARPVGGAVVLKALHVRCAAPAGEVTVSVEPTGEVVTLRDNGLGDDEAAGDGVYSGRWVASVAGDHTLTFATPERDSLVVHVDPHLRSGFPVQTRTDFINESPRVLADSLVVGNIAGDDRLEIVASSVEYGPIHAWSEDGSIVTGWPNWDLPLAAQLSLGEFNGSPGRLEIAAMHFWRGMRLYDGAGVQLPGWPQASNVVVQGHAPATADLDQDGVDELLMVPARRSNGSLFAGSGGFPALGAGPLSTVVYADLDADGTPEAISADPTQLWASSRSGPLPGFPVTLTGDRTYPPQYPVVGDVTGDGKPDIVLAHLYYDGIRSTERVEVFGGNGKLQHAWQFVGDWATVMPALADLTGDGVPEILMQDGSKAFAWSGNGQSLPGWPIGLEQFYNYGTQPVVGDLDGDGRPDVVLMRGPMKDGRGVVHALDSQGRELQGYPKILWSVANPTTPAIADLDHDGRNELVVFSVPDIGLRDGVFVYGNSLPGTDGPVEWGQFMEGSSRHGYYELGKSLKSEAYLSVQAHGAGRVSSSDGNVSCGTDCAGKYTKGATVVLTAATTAASARFAGWIGACSGQGNPCTLRIGSYTATAANFDTPLTASTSGSGTVRSSDGSIACPGQCSSVFPARARVVLTASAAANNAFDHWEGACAGTAATCTVIADDAKSVTAVFVDRRMLTVARTGTGQGTVTSSDGTLNCGPTCSVGFVPGSTVQLIATANPDSYVEWWSIDGCRYSIERCSVTLDAARTVTVSFALKPVLTISKSGAGTARVVSTPAGIDCGAACSAPMPPDSQIDLRAIPSPDSYVVGWQDCSAPFGQACTAMMTSSRNVVVQLALRPTLTVTIDGTGEGRVMDGTGSWSCDRSCTQRPDPTLPHVLTASPSPGSVFVGWGGVCAGSSGSCTLPGGGDAVVTATFNSTGGSGGGSGGGGGGGGSTGGGSSGGGGGRTSFPELLLLIGAAALRGRRGQVRDPDASRMSPAAR